MNPPMQPYELDAWLGDTELTRDQREDFERSIDMIAARYPAGTTDSIPTRR